MSAVFPRCHLPLYGVVVLSLFLSTGLVGCGVISSLLSIFSSDDTPPTTSLQSIRVVSDAQANSNTAVMLDIVFVYQQSLLAQLPGNAPDWFRQRANLAIQSPQGLQIVNLQIPPHYVLESVALPSTYQKAFGVLVYANYLAKPGQTPLNITLGNNITVHLAAKKIVQVERNG